MLQNCIDIFRENPDIDKMIFDVYHQQMGPMYLWRRQ